MSKELLKISFSDSLLSKVRGIETIESEKRKPVVRFMKEEEEKEEAAAAEEEMEPMSLEEAKLSCQSLASFLGASSGPSSNSNSASNSPHQSDDNLDLLLNTNSRRVLLLDLRSFLLYNQSHIKGAINVCIPKTLVKRPGFSVKNIETGICKKTDKDTFKQHKRDAVVVLYEQNGHERDPNGLLEKCFESLVREGLCHQIFWLEGGFAKMQRDYPEWIRTSRNSKSGKSGLPALETLSSYNNTKDYTGTNLLNLGPFTAPPSLHNLEDAIVEITDYLYLSGSRIAEDKECLKRHNIGYIINTAVELQDPFNDGEEFVYKRLELNDHPSQQMCVVNVFQNAFNFIEEARKNGKKTLVHCRGGRSRSPTVVIAYLMKTYNWTLQQAYDHVQAKNPKISPNLGFMGQLTHFEELLQQSRTSEQKERGDENMNFQLSDNHRDDLLHASQSLEGLNSLGSFSLDVHS